MSSLKVIGNLVFDTCLGKFHRVNESAAFVLTELITNQKPVSEIIAAYSRRYKVPQAVASRDIEFFLDDLNVVR